MKVNPRTIKIILDFVAAFATAAGTVVVKDFLLESSHLETPKD